MRFTDKTVLITGGSRGIGAAAAKMFDAEGAQVVFTYLANEQAARDTLDQLGEGASAIMADLSSPADIDRIFERIRIGHDRIDVLVNNVGISVPHEWQTLPLSNWSNTLMTNVGSMLLCAQHAVPMMPAGSSIVNVSSLRGLSDHGRPPILDYSVSKAAVISLTKTLAKAVAPSIRVNCVSPGVTNTAITKTFPTDLLKSFVSSIYLGRLIEPDEVASAILFLSSSDGSGITGVNLRVDGGQSLGR